MVRIVQMQCGVSRAKGPGGKGRVACFKLATMASELRRIWSDCGKGRKRGVSRSLLADFWASACTHAISVSQCDFSLRRPTWDVGASASVEIVHAPAPKSGTLASYPKIPSKPPSRRGSSSL